MRDTRDTRDLIDNNIYRDRTCTQRGYIYALVAELRKTEDQSYTTNHAHNCNNGVLCTDACGYLCYNSESEQTVTHMTNFMLTDG